MSALSSGAGAEISTPGIMSRPYLRGYVKRVDELGIMHGEFFDITGHISATRIKNYYLDVAPSALAELVTGAPIGCYEAYTDEEATAATCFTIKADSPFGEHLDIYQQLKDKGVRLGCNYWDKRAKSNENLPIGSKCH